MPISNEQANLANTALVSLCLTAIKNLIQIRTFPLIGQNDSYVNNIHITLTHTNACLRLQSITRQLIHLVENKIAVYFNSIKRACVGFAQLKLLQTPSNVWPLL